DKFTKLKIVLFFRSVPTTSRCPLCPISPSRRLKMSVLLPRQSNKPPFLVAKLRDFLSRWKLLYRGTVVLLPISVEEGSSSFVILKFRSFLFPTDHKTSLICLLLAQILLLTTIQLASTRESSLN